MDLLFVVWFQLWCAIIAGFQAEQKNRSVGGWFFQSLLIGSFFSIILLRVLPRLDKQEKTIAAPAPQPAPAPTPALKRSRIDLLIQSLEEAAPAESIRLLVNTLNADGYSTDALLVMIQEHGDAAVTARFQDAIA